jgi:uncharacterized protein YxjI
MQKKVLCMAKFCPKCGDPLNPGQKFCEKCGATADGASSAPVQVKVGKGTTSVAAGHGGLFDQSRNFYILKEKYWDWGSGPILDETNKEIGKMHRKLLSLRAKIEFQEMDGTISASIKKKLVSVKPTHSLVDADDKMLGRLKKTFWSFIRPKFYFEDAKGNKMFEAQGKFMGFNFTVTDMSGKLLATINKADKWRDIFLKGLFDFKDTYALKIEDPDVDRRNLLGFVIAIDNTLHDGGRSSGGLLRIGT